MKFIVIALVMICALPPRAALAQDLKPLLAHAMQNRAIPAMGILTIRNGRIADTAVIGMKAAGHHAKATLQDVWHIGSDTKAMTAALIARLVERGTLSWQTPLDRALPQLKESMQPAYRDITMVDMFAHRAGFKDMIDSDVYNAFYSDRRPIHEQRLAYMRMALAQPAAYPPRTQNLYSNRGPLLAATIAEAATHRSYEDLMRSEVFGPLHMRSAGFGPTHPGEILGHEEGKPVSGPKADNPAVLFPAGGVHLSLQDWAAFAIDEMKGETAQGKLLTADGYRFLHSAVGDTIYGLGWGVRTSLDGVNARFLTHSGSNGFWFARIVLAPDTQSGVLIVANAGGDAGADIAVQEIEQAIVPTLVRSQPTSP